jgi:sialidase-1
MIKLTIFLLFFMLIIGLISGGEIRNKVDVFISGQDGVAFYRIPALVTSNKGTLIAICDARIESIYDAPNNIDLAMKQSFDNGKTWTAMKIILDYLGLEAAGDPCLLVDRETGTVKINKKT